MGENSIRQLMETAFQSLLEMVDVNTVVGDMLQAGEVSVVPISRVSCGFAAGGGEYGQSREDRELPFGGGSGAGLSVVPMGFLVSAGSAVRFIPVEEEGALSKAIDVLPSMIEQFKELIGKEQ